MPAPGGWIVLSGAERREAASMAEVAEGLPAEGTLQLALPCTSVLVERMRLPTIEASEVEDMARLQLEKTLPFPIEDMTTACEVLSKDESESQVLALAVHHPALETLCAPLRQKLRLPEKVTLFAQHAATVCPPGQNVLLIYRESDKVVMAVVDNRTLIAAQTMDHDDVTTELTPWLISAELDGLPVAFARICIEEGCSEFVQALEAALPGVPVEKISLINVEHAISSNLMPPAWRLERRKASRMKQVKKQLMIAGGIWLGLALIALGWVFFLDNQLARINRKIAKVQPDLEFVSSRQGRWLRLAPAIDPARYAVEIMRQIQEALPSPEIRVTQFASNPTGFQMDGEAPSAAMAIDLVEKLKAAEGLRDFTITAGNPAILPDERAQFRIFGKL